MKQVIVSLVAALFLIGCATTQNTAGKLLASTAITVDGAMQGWATYVVAVSTTPEQITVSQEEQVKVAYQKYQASMAVASSAYAALAAGGNKTAWESAAKFLTDNQAALLSLITSFQTKGK